MFVALVFVVAVVLLVGLSIYSRRAPVLGMKNGRLRPCGPKPNCVCSEEIKNRRQSQNITGINYKNSGLEDNEAWEIFKKMLIDLNAKQFESEENYLRCIFVSKLWRFIDDFEARLDRESKCIHMRSASRVGYSDLGLNHKRVQNIKEKFDELIEKS